MRRGSVVGPAMRSCLQDHGEALADADAECGEAEAAAAGVQLVREPGEDPPARRAQRMADRDRAAANVDQLGVELRPRANAGQRLRRERLVELDAGDPLPADP